MPLAAWISQAAEIAACTTSGVVQAILVDPTADWLDFYQSRSASRCCRRANIPAPAEGHAARKSLRKFYLQLIEPPPGSEEIRWDEAWWPRLAHATFRRPRTPAGTRHRVRRPRRRATQRKGALSRSISAGQFELVVSHLKP